MLQELSVKLLFACRDQNTRASKRGVGSMEIISYCELMMTQMSCQMSDFNIF